MTVRRPDSLSEIEATEVGQHGNDKLWRQSGLNKMNSTHKINPVWKQSAVSHSFFLYFVIFHQAALYFRALSLSSKYGIPHGGGLFPIHLDKISKDPKCVAVTEMADLSPKFSNRSIAVPNLTLLYIKPTGCDNLLGD